jgi:hypothetical protein
VFALGQKPRPKVVALDEELSFGERIDEQAR